MPRPRHRSKLRTPLIVAGSIAVVVIVALILANTASSGSKPKATKPGEKGTVPTTTGVPPLKLAIGQVNIQNTGPPAKVRPPVRRVLLAAAQKYVDDALLAPLEQGKVVNAYERIFDPGVKAAASGPDRGVLTDAKIGRARGPVHAVASRVDLSAIGDQTGKPALVATTFTLTIRATTPSGPVVIRRLTEFTFANEFGTWAVTAYNVGVRRTVGARTTAKTATTGALMNGDAL